MAGPWNALTAPGGGEVQLHATHKALCSEGVDARLWRPWEDSLGEFHVLHLFGSRPEFLSLAESAHSRGLKVAVSPIAWFDLASYWCDGRTRTASVLNAARFLARSVLPAIRSWRKQLYRLADLLLPNSKAEARQLVRFFRVDLARIHVVPNAASESFASGSPEAFAARVGARGFVLCAGRIEPRKNQLGLLRALKGLDVPIVILGNAVPGHEAYHAACRKEAGGNVRFVPALSHDDPLLASAYQAAGCLVMPSRFETPGLAALEAGSCGLPLVLTRRGSAVEYFGQFASYVDPGDGPGIRRAVETALGMRRNPLLARHVLSHFTWRHAALATRTAYESLV
jgi:glycosyltransferase involved in cell wall biosynthesis